MTSPFPSARILVIDDLPAIHEDYRKILTGSLTDTVDDDARAIFGMVTPAETALPFQLDCALQGQDGVALAQKALAAGDPYCVAFVDMRMPPGWDGVETIRHLWAIDPRIEVVICTAYSDYSWSDTVKSLGTRDNLIILRKPFDNVEVSQLAHALCRKWHLAREAEERIASLDNLVARRTIELRAAEDDFASAFEASPLPQAIVSLERFEFLAVNQSFREAFGLTVKDFSGLTPESFGRGFDPERWRRARAQLMAGESIDEHPFAYQPVSGVQRELRCSARPLILRGQTCSIWVIRDVTDHVRLENQVRHAQKMEAIGQLSAGVAHDFNNLLTAIQVFTDEALGYTRDPQLREMLTPIQTATLRAATLTRQLLLFSRRQAVEVRQVDVVATLKELLPLLRRLVPEHTELRHQLPPTLPPVLADTANLEQILVNLVVNARDALPPRGGRIELSLTLKRFRTAQEAGHADGRPGTFVAIRVADNGTGIAPDVLPRIFEPFFTTKEVGKGTGLGLSTVYSLVREQGGWVDVHTEIGLGTAFTIFYPVAAPASEPPPATLVGDSQAPLQLPAIRVLAAEDDLAVQMVLQRFFRDRSFEAVIASDGPQALRLWEEKGGSFDLLVTDLVMPNGMTGLDVARRLRTFNPGLKVIVTTGYSAELLEPAQLDIPGGRPHVVMKPFTVRDMTRAIERVMTSQPAMPVLAPA